MRKVLLLSVVLVFCAAVGLASFGDKGGATEATIWKLDMASKSMVVKTIGGQEMTIYWNESTQLEGVLKEGETIHVKTSEKDGKTWATWVHVGAMKHK
jgi:hypothetical protein